jgi:small ubiquitin-related modifier
LLSVFFKVKKTTQFKKVFDAYYARVGKAKGTIRFVLDGKRINETQTPADVRV